MKKIFIIALVLLQLVIVSYASENNDFMQTMKCGSLNKKFNVDYIEYETFFCASVQDKAVKEKNINSKETLDAAIVLKSDGNMLQIYDALPSAYGNSSALDDFLYGVLKIGKATLWGEVEKVQSNFVLGWGKIVYKNGKKTKNFEMKADIVGDIAVVSDLYYKSNPAKISIPIRDLQVLEHFIKLLD